MHVAYLPVKLAEPAFELCFIFINFCLQFLSAQNAIKRRQSDKAFPSVAHARIYYVLAKLQ